MLWRAFVQESIPCGSVICSHPWTNPHPIPGGVGWGFVLIGALLYTVDGYYPGRGGVGICIDRSITLHCRRLMLTFNTDKEGRAWSLYSLVTLS